MRGHDKSVISLTWCPVPVNVFPRNPDNEVGRKKCEIELKNENKINLFENAKTENLEISDLSVDMTQILNKSQLSIESGEETAIKGTYSDNDEIQNGEKREEIQLPLIETKPTIEKNNTVFKENQTILIINRKIGEMKCDPSITEKNEDGEISNLSANRSENTTVCQDDTTQTCVFESAANKNYTVNNNDKSENTIETEPVLENNDKENHTSAISINVCYENDKKLPIDPCITEETGINIDTKEANLPPNSKENDTKTQEIRMLQSVLSESKFGIEESNIISVAEEDILHNSKNKFENQDMKGTSVNEPTCENIERQIPRNVPIEEEPRKEFLLASSAKEK